MPEKLIPFLDVLILAEIFEAFRYECMANFELEPAHFLSLPSFAYQVYNNSIIICTNKASDSFSFFYFNYAFLKKTQAKLEYIRDEEMLKLLQENLRGGLSFQSQRCISFENHNYYIIL